MIARRDLAVSAAQAAAVDELVAAATERGSVSVVRGVRGVGRTSTLDMVAARLATSGSHVLTLRGRSGEAGRHQPMAGLDPEVWPESGGVLVIDDADHLGEVDSAVVASMVAEGSASAVVAVGDGPMPLAAIGLLRLTTPLTLELPPLDEDESAALARRVLGGPVSPALGADLVAVTGGLPGRIVETVAAWRDEGAIAVRRGVWMAEGTLTTVTEARDPIAALGPEHRRVVELCALARLISLASLESAVDEDVLVDLERSGIIEVVDDGAQEGVRLRDTGVAAAVDRGLTTERRRALLTDLVALVDPSGVATGLSDRALLGVVSWRLELELPVDPALALRAGRSALVVGDTSAALLLGRAAWEGARTVASAVLYATALERSGDAPAAFRVLSASFGLSASADERSAVIAGLVANHLHADEDPGSTIAYAAQLLDEVDEPTERAAALAASAYVAVMSGEVDVAGHLTSQVDSAAATEPVLATVAFVDLVTRTLTGRPMTDWSEPPGSAEVDVGVLAASDAFALFRILRGVQVLDPAEAAARASDLGRDARSRGAMAAEGWAAWLEAYGLLLGGHLFDARDAADRAWRLFAPLGLDSRLRAVLCLMELVDALLAGGADPHTTASGGSTGPGRVADLLPSGSTWYFKGEQLRFASLALSVDDPVEAGRRLVEAADALSERGLRVGAVWTHIEAALLGHRFADPGQAEAMLDVALEVAAATAPEAPGEPRSLLSTAAAAAHALATDDGSDGVRLVQSIEEMVAGGHLLHAHLALTTALGPDRPTGRDERSALLELAMRVARSSDLSPVSTPADADVLAALSDRELAVARLVAGGLTNREAADRIGRSKKTVDNTLGSIYRKLGISDRSALAILLGSADAV